jgi:hypothetical protein
MQDDLKKPDNHCPFGCGDSDLDSHGYCDHLIGFTNDGQTFEPLGHQKKWNKEDKEWQETGHRIVARKGYGDTATSRTAIVQKIQKHRGDTLVNPTVEVYDAHAKITKRVQLWVSARVYSKNPEARTPVIVEEKNKNAVPVGAES